MRSSSRRRRACMRRWCGRRLIAACTSSARSRSVLDVADGERAGRAGARASRCVTQVGYHYRFVGAFKEAARLVGRGRSARSTTSAPRPTGRSCCAPRARPGARRRTKAAVRSYDYACHAIDLVNFIVGAPSAVDGVVRHSVFSRDVDDEVYATFRYPDGASGQLCVNWSDESFRKMSTKISVWGTKAASPPTVRSASSSARQQHVRCPMSAPAGTVRYTTDLTDRSGSTCAARNTRRRSTTSPERQGGPPRRRIPSPRRSRPTSGRRDDARRQAELCPRRSGTQPPGPVWSRIFGDIMPLVHCAQAQVRDGPRPVRRQPVLRRQPHVGGEGARPVDAFQD